jgi:hypothetical protein
MENSVENIHNDWREHKINEYYMDYIEGDYGTLYGSYMKNGEKINIKILDGYFIYNETKKVSSIRSTRDDEKIKIYNIKNFNFLNHLFESELFSYFHGKLDIMNKTIDGDFIMKDERCMKIKAHVKQVKPELILEEIYEFEYSNSLVEHSISFAKVLNVIKFKSSIVLGDNEYMIEYDEIENNKSFTVYHYIIDISNKRNLKAFIQEKLTDNKIKSLLMTQNKNKYCNYLLNTIHGKSFEYLCTDVIISNTPDIMFNLIIEEGIDGGIDYLKQKSFNIKHVSLLTNYTFPREYNVNELYNNYDLFEPLYSSLDILNYTMDDIKGNCIKIKYNSETQEREEKHYTSTNQLKAEYEGKGNKLTHGKMYFDDGNLTIKFTDGIKYITKIESTTKNKSHVELNIDYNVFMMRKEIHPDVVKNAKIYSNDENIINIIDGAIYFQLSYINDKVQDKKLYIKNIPVTFSYYDNRQFLFKIDIVKVNYMNIFTCYAVKDRCYDIEIYRADKLMFKGDYYCDNKDSEFIGEFISEDKIKLNGEFNCDFILNGLGSKKIIDKDKRIIKSGTFSNGKLIEPIYIGEVNEHEKPHGRGTYFDKNFRYSGVFENGTIKNGIKYNNELIVYEGEFDEYLPHGVGKEYMPDGTIHEGNFSFGAFIKN